MVREVSRNSRCSDGLFWCCRFIIVFYTQQCYSIIAKHNNTTKENVLWTCIFTSSTFLSNADTSWEYQLHESPLFTSALRKAPQNVGSLKQRILYASVDNRKASRFVSLQLDGVRFLLLRIGQIASRLWRACSGIWPKICPWSLFTHIHENNCN